MPFISLPLIVLALGVALLLYAKYQLKLKYFWPTFASWFIIVLAFISILCSIYFYVTKPGFGYHKKQMKMMEKMEKREMAE